MTNYNGGPKDRKAIAIRKLETYILIIKVKQHFRKRIGAGGVRQFDPGYYLYVGSGKANLVQRIKRHLGMKKKKFWHVDYLLSSKQASIRDIFITELPEEKVVTHLEKSSTANSYDGEFGSTDSKKPTHLFYCKNYCDLARLKEIMGKWY